MGDLTFRIEHREAKALGLPRYFTGRPCRDGHIAERYTKNGDCMVCLVKKRSKWRAKNSAKRTADTSRWRSENPKKARALWAHLASARRARAFSATPKWVGREALSAIYRDCPKGFHVDHIVPLSSHLVCGLHVPWNLQYLPAHANRSKGNKLVLPC